MQNFIEISGPFLVVFREMLEIVLIVGMVLAATKGVAGRFKWSAIGAGAGILGAAILAVFTDSISEAAEGMGQELVNGGILIAASLMIGWTVVWMKHHAREIGGNLRRISNDINEGRAHLYTLSAVIALAILREGSEIVLFTYGMLGSGMSWQIIAEGAVLGVIAGTVLGVMFYYGLTRVFTKHFFNVSSWVLALLASGLAAQGMAKIAAAGVLPEMGMSIWDTSAILPETSALGSTLKILVGYASNPSGIQIATYLAAFAIIAFFMQKHRKPVFVHATQQHAH